MIRTQRLRQVQATSVTGTSIRPLHDTSSVPKEYRRFVTLAELRAPKTPLVGVYRTPQVPADTVTELPSTPIEQSATEKASQKCTDVVEFGQSSVVDTLWIVRYV